MGEHHRPARPLHDLQAGAVAGMRAIHDQAELVDPVDDPPAERRQPGIVAMAAGVVTDLMDESRPEARREFLAQAARLTDLDV